MFFFFFFLNLWFPAYYTITQIEASCSIIIYTTMPQLLHPLLVLIVCVQVNLSPYTVRSTPYMGITCKCWIWLQINWSIHQQKIVFKHRRGCSPQDHSNYSLSALSKVISTKKQWPCFSVYPLRKPIVPQEGTVFPEWQW